MNRETFNGIVEARLASLAAERNELPLDRSGLDAVVSLVRRAAVLREPSGLGSVLLWLIDLDIKVQDGSPEGRCCKARKQLIEKGKSYAYSMDRLENFSQGAKFLLCTQAWCCFSFMVKHLERLHAMLVEPVSHSAEQWDERIGDAFNYVLILETCCAPEVRP